MDKIGTYEILEILHRGPQPLYRAKGKDGREVAVKAIPVANLTPESRERFTREAETCRALDHPNLTRVFEIGEADGMLYQAMELLVGADLGKVMGEGRVFTWEQKLWVMEQITEGLEYAHARKLVHRDIKPANIFLEDSGRVRLLDFGMVRVAESQLTKLGSSLGTLNYMAPEQIRGDRCTAATDVFSAGIVFYQLASGRHPFSDKTRSLPQVVSAIVFETPPPLSQLCPDAPQGLEFVLNRALEKDPGRRWQNASALKQGIVLCRMTMSMTAAPPPPANDFGATRVMNAPATIVSEDDGKARVVRPAAAPVGPAVEEKTRLMQRMPSPAPSAPPAPAAAAPVLPAPSQLPKARKPAPAQFRYCPACTFANPAGAAVCIRCQTPLAGGTPAANDAGAPARSSNISLYIAVCVAVALAVALAVVLISK